MKKIIFLFGIVCFIILFSGLISADDGILKCSVKNPNLCTDSRVLYFQNGTGGTDNAHAGLPSAVNYTNSVCCYLNGYNLPIQTTCDDISGKFLRLSNATNAHVQNYSIGTYSFESCMSLSGDSYITCQFRNTTCLSSETCIISVNKTDNSHVASCGGYSNNVCCKAIVGSDYNPPAGGGGGSDPSEITYIKIISPDEWWNGTEVNLTMEFLTQFEWRKSPNSLPSLTITPNNSLLLTKLIEIAPGKMEATYSVPTNVESGEYVLNVTIIYPRLSSFKTFQVKTSESKLEPFKSLPEKIWGVLVDDNQTDFLGKYWIIILITLFVYIFPILIIIALPHKLWDVLINNHKTDFFGRYWVLMLCIILIPLSPLIIMIVTIERVLKQKLR